MPFLDELDTRDLGGGNSALLGRFRYQTLDTGEIIECEKGFVTDFASIPRLFRVIVTGNDNTKKPAVPHDKTYRANHTHKTFIEGYKARLRADKVMLMGMKDQRTPVPWYKRWAVYAGIRAGGAFSWNRSNDNG